MYTIFQNRRNKPTRMAEHKNTFHLKMHGNQSNRSTLKGFIKHVCKSSAHNDISNLGMTILIMCRDCIQKAKFPFHLQISSMIMAGKMNHFRSYSRSLNTPGILKNMLQIAIIFNYETFAYQNFKYVLKI